MSPVRLVRAIPLECARSVIHNDFTLVRARVFGHGSKSRKACSHTRLYSEDRACFLVIMIVLSMFLMFILCLMALDPVRCLIQCQTEMIQAWAYGGVRSF